MLFDMTRLGNSIGGWVAPDNPGTVPRIRIVRPDGSSSELETNVFRPDVKDQGLHPTGQAGFGINDNLFPDLGSFINDIEIYDCHTGVLLYRAFSEVSHIPMKVLRFDMQALPYAHIEAAWNRNFALHYSAAERFPFETMFGILNNPAARSVAISGRINMDRYEHLFRERDYKILAMLRHPYEDMAERLLFVRYAMAPQSSSSFEEHLTGLRCLGPSVQKINLDQPQTIVEFFSKLSPEEKAALSNPLVKALACKLDERPRKQHIQIALHRLSTMDLVGIKPRHSEFQRSLAELVGRDIYGDLAQPELSWTKRVVSELERNAIAVSLVTLDLQLYQIAEKAVQKALLVTPSEMEMQGNFSHPER